LPGTDTETRDAAEVLRPRQQACGTEPGDEQRPAVMLAPKLKMLNSQIDDLARPRMKRMKRKPP
jgi:hypothetical protein